MANLSAFPITHKLPAQHPDRLQFYSLPTPNGVKVSIMLEETGTSYTGATDSRPLGEHGGRAIYLLYNGILKDKSVGGGNVLTAPVFDILPPFAGAKTIYAAACRLGTPRLQREQLVFNQTPYALAV